MKIGTAINHKERAISRLRGCYGMARIMGLTSDELNDRIMTQVFNPIAKCPEWVKAEVRGYWRALHDKAYENDLVFGVVTNSIFYSTHSDRPDYYAKQGINACEFNLCLKDNAAGHYWSEPLKNGRIKPFYIGNK